MSMGDRVLVQVAKNLLLQTAGGSGQGVNTYILDLGAWADRFWMLAGVRAMTVGANRTTNASWKLVYWWQLHDGTWIGPLDLTNAIVTDTSTIHGEVVDQTTFAPRTRVGIQMSASAGAAVESVLANAWLVLRLG
jgi:hypothetical protein